jgi:hypothetical protein
MGPGWYHALMSTAALEHERAHDDGGDDYDTRHPCRSVMGDVPEEAAIVTHICGPVIKDFHRDNSSYCFSGGGIGMSGSKGCVS